MLLVDFRWALDSVKRLKLYEAMRVLGISLKLMQLTKMDMRHIKAKIKYENILNESFIFTKGVKQGDGLSAPIFISALHYAI